MAASLDELINAFMTEGSCAHITINMGRHGPVVAMRRGRDTEYTRDQLSGEDAATHLREALMLALGGKTPQVKPKRRRRTDAQPETPVDDADDILAGI